MSAIAFVGAVLIAGYLRTRRWRPLAAIAVSAALLPIGITFESFVYPAEAESRMWWQVAMLFSPLYGLAAASVGYVVVSFLLKRRGA